MLDSLNLTVADRCITSFTTGTFLDYPDLRLLIDPQEDQIWAATPMRWINVAPIFEFILSGLDIDPRGHVQFLSSPDETTFMEQLGHTRDKPPSDELFPGVVFPRRIVDCIRSGRPQQGVPVWFTEGFPFRVNILWGDNPFFHEWCISLVRDDPDDILLYNPVRVHRASFVRTREENVALNFPTTFS